MTKRISYYVRNGCHNCKHLVRKYLDGQEDDSWYMHPYCNLNKDKPSIRSKYENQTTAERNLCEKFTRNNEVHLCGHCALHVEIEDSVLGYFGWKD